MLPEGFTGWTDATRVGGFAGVEPSVVLHESGDIRVLCTGFGAPSSTYWNRFDAATGCWQGADALPTPDGQGSGFVTVRAVGNDALAVFSRSITTEPTDQGRRHAARYTGCSGWSPSTPPQTTGTGTVREHALATNPGETSALALWVEDGSAVQSARYDGGSWSYLDRVNEGAAGSADSPALAWIPGVGAIAAWHQFTTNQPIVVATATPEGSWSFRTAKVPNAGGGRDCSRSRGGSETTRARCV